eukprot:318818_1
MMAVLRQVFVLITILCCGMCALQLDESTTTTQIIQSLDEKQTLAGRLAIVTGATSGLGKETVRSLAMLDCTVIMAVRNIQKALNVKDEMKGKIHIMQLDLASLASVLRFAKEVHRQYDEPIDYLFNNAAVMAIPNYTATSDGFEQQIGVNYLGHYYLTRLLMDKFIQNTRIISVSSRASNYATNPIVRAIESMEKSLVNDHAMRIGYKGWRNYGISKAFQILFARELQRRMGQKGIISVSLHPGVIKSGLQKFLTEELINSDEFQFDKNIQQGTATQLWLALMPLEQVVPGGYYVDCQFHDDVLRDDLKPDETSNVIDTMENRLWQVSEKLIRKKGFAFSYTSMRDKDDL